LGGGSDTVSFLRGGAGKKIKKGIDRAKKKHAGNSVNRLGGEGGQEGKGPPAKCIRCQNKKKVCWRNVEDETEAGKENKYGVGLPGPVVVKRVNWFKL